MARVLPLIQSDTLRAVAAALQNHAVALPLYQGQRGHPVGFSGACGAALLNLRGPEGAAAVVRVNVAFELSVNDIGCVTDIDTVDDLRAAERLQHGA